MDRILKRPWSLLLSLLASASAIFRSNDHGFWFDEAYTARLATLPLDRALQGAVQDIHPPGYVFCSWIFAQLPIPVEMALRLPSCLGFGLLVFFLSRKNSWLGVSILLHSAFVDQSTQARPYLLLALGLFGLRDLLESRRWAWAGLVGGLCASLQAIAPAFVAILWLTSRPDRHIWKALPGLASILLWLPFWLPEARHYASSPWYEAGHWYRWGILGDGLWGSIALVVAILWSRPGWRLWLAPGLCTTFLLILECSGFGVEIQKVGIGLTVLWLTSVSDRVAPWVAAAFLLSSAPTLVRPDLREAAKVVEGSPYPVVSVFASETAFYLRNPQPLPSDRVPSQIRERLERDAEKLPAPCLWAIHLPGTVPEDLGHLKTLQMAPVTGLDVRLVGTEACTALRK